MARPKVIVLMATFNGVKWIEEQVKSILNQEGVFVQLVISDDNSTDGTYEWLESVTKQDERVTLLPRGSSNQKGAAGNFYHLLRTIETHETCFYALSDQDDIWYPTKLVEQCKILSEYHFEATSSNVNATWPDGTIHLINKSQRQRRYDYFFESAGPGCSYCFNAHVLSLVKQYLKGRQKTELPNLHDWFIYAVCRVNEIRWWIDPKPQLAYRQHHHNQVGAHAGWFASWTRFKVILKGDYRAEVNKLADLLGQSHSDQTKSFCQRLIRLKLADRWFLLTHAHQLRRKKQDRLILAILIMCCIY